MLSLYPKGVSDDVTEVMTRRLLLLQQPTLSDMTKYELNFSLLVEQMLSKIIDPTYRQIIVEVRPTTHTCISSLGCFFLQVTTMI